MQNSMMIFSFLVFEWKYPFWANLVQNIKIVTLCWNLVPTLIRTCRIQWWFSFILFLIGNILFGQIWSKKIKIIGWSLNLVARLIQICWIQWCCSLFSFLIGSALLGQIWSKLSIFTGFFCFRSEMLFVGKIWSKMSKLSV